MDNTDVLDYQQGRLNLAKDLVNALEQGRSDDADIIVLNMAGMRESYLFQELGKLTRELHEALKNFMLDDRIASIAVEDMPDARVRLKHVIEMTDQSATRTLNAVEAALPLCSTLLQTSKDLSEQWQRFTKREMQPDEFRVFGKHLGDYFNKNNDEIAAVEGHLKDILMAQDFQDLTGQIIKKVIHLVDEVEKNLVNLIKLAGGKRFSNGSQVPLQEELAGPQIPGLESSSAVKGQDEVDTLLASFGF
ncbi:MAG: protein phosphatase CheZ [Gammaproteobacteria bacterium]|nr:protein phosphatase CheZ [Gammaproteobacteria bacterium]